MINRLSKLFISIIYLACYKFYTFVVYCITKQNHKNHVVLCYHEVTSKQREKFAGQLDCVKKCINPVTIDHQKIKNDNNVLITFDDGFQCLLENAIPELSMRKIPAILFIPSGYLGRSPGWIIDQYDNNHNELVMTTEQLKDLPADLITIGSHCVTHPNLTLYGEKKVKEELTKSKMDLERILDREVNVLALPLSAYNQKIIKWAKQAGYKHVFAGQSTCFSNNNNTFLQGRIITSPDDWLIEFRLKLIGAYQWLPLAIAIKRVLYRNVLYRMYGSKANENKCRKQAGTIVL